MNGIKWRVGMTIREVEKSIIEASMRYFDGNKTKVAASLGISLRTIDNKLNLYKRQELNEATSAS